MIRKHLKVECARWYSHCDHIGMLVWQDMINGGGRSIQTFLLYLPTVLPFVTTEFRDNCYPLFSRTSKTGREWWKRECRETVHQLYNAPCVSLWVLFNEGWGQFDAREMTEMVRALDPTRQIDHASGWYDQGAGDIKSLHNYFRPLKVKPEERAFAFSEYGGYTYPVQEHLLLRKSIRLPHVPEPDTVPESDECTGRKDKRTHRTGTCRSSLHTAYRCRGGVERHPYV